MFTNQSYNMSPLARRCLIFVVTNNRGLSILLVGATHWLNNQCHVSIQIWGTSPPVAKYISRWKVDPLCSKKFIKKTVYKMIYRCTSDFLPRFTTRVMQAQFQQNRDNLSIWSCPFFSPLYYVVCVSSSISIVHCDD